MAFFNKLSSLVGGKTVNDSSAGQPSAPPPKKVLIVEDDKYLRDFYSELLTSEGFTTITAENGQSGLEAVKMRKPDVVMLDLLMPIIDGKTMLHQMRQIPEFAKTPVIVLTNAGETDNIHETEFFDNAKDFLIKSNVTPDEIVKKIKMFI